MKKRTLRALAALAALALAAGPALAEGGLIGALASSGAAATEAPTPAPTAAATEAPTPMPTVTPTATPAGEEISAGGLRVTLPAGMAVLADDALEGYDAAARFDYPGAGETVLAAVDAERSAALTIAAAESEASPLDAAREAAEALCGSADAAQELSFGENACAGFACTLGEQEYRLYFLDGGERLLAVGMSGLADGEVEMILTSLEA